MSNSSYPSSVQPGIPQLGDIPSGWARTKMNQHLEKMSRRIKLINDRCYELVTVRRSRGGVESRGNLRGNQIAVKSQFKVSENDFLISKRQIVHGACGIVPSALEGAIVSNEYDVFRCLPTLNISFLSYLSHTVYFQQTCFHSSIGVHVEKMIFKTDRWLEFDFKLPPPPEQEKIATILSTWDAAIAANEELLANSRQRKKALMQKLLTGKVRLQNGYGELFAYRWKEYRFGDFATIKSPKLAPGGHVILPCIELEHIEQETGRITGSLPSESVGSTKNIFSSGSVLFSKLRPYLQKYAMPDFSGACSSEIWVISPSGEIACPEYIYQLVQSEPFVKGASKSSGSKMPRAEWSVVREIRFRIPALPEQRAIAEVLTVASEEIRTLEHRIDNLKLQKKALMQQLLTGKKRVNVDPITQ